MVSDELAEELSSWKDLLSDTEGDGSAASLTGVNVRITEGSVLTSLIVSLSFNRSVDVSELVSEELIMKIFVHIHNSEISLELKTILCSCQKFIYSSRESMWKS